MTASIATRTGTYSIVARRYGGKPCGITFIVRPEQYRIPCPRPAAWRVIKTCPAGHEETVLRCHRCHTDADDGLLVCSTCQPADVSVITVAAEPLR